MKEMDKLMGKCQSRKDKLKKNLQGLRTELHTTVDFMFEETLDHINKEFNQLHKNLDALRNSYEKESATIPSNAKLLALKKSLDEIVAESNNKKKNERHEFSHKPKQKLYVLPAGHV